MINFFLRLNPLDRTKAMLEGCGLKLRCAIGRNGVITRKREGDGGTPRATLKPLRIFCARTSGIVELLISQPSQLRGIWAGVMTIDRLDIIG